MKARVGIQKENRELEVDCYLLTEANPLTDKLTNGWQDMVQMNILNEPEILNNLRIRYNKDVIYT